ncbi:SMC family ATPase [Nanchangia anserum]|uniref:Nuclease SbcCD subunit C n=1 Tax=Nanchangia anserum TaxID=2692125 RepID=A0A8I0GAB2_9ACTO|nr:SMC family ATPase [Nanchangia anserum]MBD3690059.1 SMC family ATPase [Nanchangia anserum]QOX82147.1 SMC family ATPase [Nanchangia anserum]
MRIHNVSFQAFGPFPGSHTIDIDALGASGIFLIDGPTGAGKSMILDAIFYGLYATLARTTTSSSVVEGRLRSQYAPASRPTQVSVVFSVPSGVYRVTRQPAYKRPKKRGHGTTEVKTRAWLYRLKHPGSPTGETIAAKANEVGIALKHILPLTADQFRQTVILPQGAFSQFLHARSDDRATLLRHIFGAEIYERVQTRLEKDAAAAQKRQETSQALLREHVASLIGDVNALGITDVPTEDEVTQDPERALAALAPHLVALDNEVAHLSQAVAHARALADGARRDLADVRVLAARRDRAHRARARLDAARERAGQIDAVREALALARAAGPVVTDWDRLTRARDDAGIARDALAADLATLSRTRGAYAAAASRLGWTPPARLATDSTPLADPDGSAPELIDDLDGLRDAARHELHDIDAAITRIRTIARMRQQRDSLVQRIDATRDAIAECETNLATIPAALSAAAAEVTASTSAREQRDDLEDARARSRERCQIADRIDDLSARLDLQHARLAEHTEALARAESAYREVHQRWSGQAAYELASGLRPDEACPVCGSREHPHVARPTEESASLADVRRALTAQADARSRVEAATRELESLEHDLAQTREALGGAGVAEVRAESARLEAEDSRLLGVIASGAQASQIVNDLTTRERHLTEERGELVTRLEADRREEGLLATQIGDLLAEARGLTDAADLADIRDTTQAVTDATASALASARELLTCCSRLQLARDDGEARLAASPFDTIEQARAAYRSADEITRDENLVTAYDAEVRSLTRECADPELREAATRILPDAGALVERARRLQERADEATREGERLRTRVEAVTAKARRVRADIDDHSAAVARDRALIRMAELAHGGKGNLESTPLSTWVLLPRFDEILAVANPKLAAITAGRYEFTRTGTDASRRLNQALSIDVIDHHLSGDHQRLNATLSGGETFYCSLALSLALTEIVTAEAGGVEIGTMFVDEGFGTLDAETLERVLAQLRSTGAGERTVGIISHIDAVRSHVPDRLEVRRNERTKQSTIVVSA